MGSDSWLGQELSGLVTDNGDGSCTLEIAGKRSRTDLSLVQAYNRAEAGEVAEKLFADMDTYFQQ